MRDIKQIAKERGIINDAIRTFFKNREYTEVETPIVVRSPGMEPNLSPFETIIVEPNGKAHRAALITSPEYSMKKLLGRGMEKIFTITKVFRNEEEFGGTHNPEFTMIEWYQQGADYHACMDETEALMRFCDEQIGQSRLQGTWKRKRVSELFEEYVGVDLGESDRQALFLACERHGIHTSEQDTESDLFYRLFLTKIEPNLKGNLFVYDYPKYQAALSRLNPDGKYGQRFELYIQGLELCNGFTELTDRSEQRLRFEEEATERALLKKTVHPIDETFLNLLPSVRTPSFGNALGVDRLHMVLTGKEHLEDVILFPASELFS